MATLDELLGAVKNQIVGHVQQGNLKNFDTEGLLGKIADLFGQHQQRSNGAANVRPSTEDVYGDPADQFHGRSVRPRAKTPAEILPMRFAAGRSIRRAKSSSLTRRTTRSQEWTRDRPKLAIAGEAGSVQRIGNG
jgi:hypothetical protein